MASLLTLSTLLTLALAQTTSFKVPYPDGDLQGGRGDLQVVSIVTANKETTILQMRCPQATSDCGLFPYHTVTYGPSTWKLDMSVDGDAFTMTQDCSFGGGMAVCKESASGSEANFPGSSTETYSEGSIWVMATAGVEKLTNGVNVTPTATPAGSASAKTGSGAVVSQTPVSTARQTSVSGSASGTPTSIKGHQQTGAASTIGRGLLGAGVGLLAGLIL